MSSGSLPLTLGVLIPGMGIAALFYGITCAQTFCYFQRNGTQDPILMKGLTAMLWLLNTLDLITIMHILYFYLISATINPSLQSVIVWTLPASSVIIGFAAFLVYTYYTWRLWTLSRNVILCVILELFAMATLISSLEFTIKGIATKMNLQQFYGPTNMRSVLVASACGTATDFLAAFSLSWYLFKNRTEMKESRSIINILIIYTINTGLLASISALCALIATILAPHTNIALCFSFMVPPLQINGYLGSLNGRQFFRRWAQTQARNNSEAVTMSSFRVASHIPPRPPRPETLDFYLEDSLCPPADPQLCMLTSVTQVNTKDQYTSDVGIAI